MPDDTVELRFQSETFKVAEKEYYWVEDQIDRFDDRSLKIKAWSITLSGVALGAGFNYNKPILFLVSAVSALIFWYLEATWKHFQQIMIERAEELELFLNGGDVEYTGPRIGRAFRTRFSCIRIELLKFPRLFLMRNVNLPHSIIFISGLYLYYYPIQSIPS
jgi:hypothetical protein